MQTKQKTIGARSHSRVLAMLGVYQFLLSANDTTAIKASLREEDGFSKCDESFLFELFTQTLAKRSTLEAAFVDFLDRPLAEVSPVERAILTVAACEMLTRLDVPYRVIINEAVELAKCYGGNDGHKFINGVLDKLAVKVRPTEVDARRTSTPKAKKT